jgi:CheY-like chemotaxis protein
MFGGLQMSNNGAGKILIADNDEHVLIALEHSLENGGYSTVTAVSHEETRKLLREEGFDLCVLDDYLSDRDSIQVLREVRRTGKMPLVVVTYHRFPGPREEEQLRSLGVSAFVNKEAHSELVDIVSHLLQPTSTRPRDAFEEMT